MTSDAAGDDEPRRGRDGDQPRDQAGDEAERASACRGDTHSATTHAIAAGGGRDVRGGEARSAAVCPAESALPALNPNQPNQSSPAPVMVIGRLWGMNFSRRVPDPLADEERADQRRQPGGPVDDGAAGEVEHAQRRHPPAVGPDPVRDRVVDQRAPEQGEGHVGAELHPLDERAADQRRGDDRELHLEGHEDQRRDAVPSACQPSRSGGGGRCPPMSPPCVFPKASE